MDSFKDFILNELGSAAGGFNVSNSNPRGDLAYAPTSALTSTSNSLMNARRRQLLDPDVPGQLYQRHFSLVRNIVPDIDTGRLIAGIATDKYKVVYTPTGLTQRHYPPEDQNILKELGILKDAKGYEFFGLYRILDQMDKTYQHKYGGTLEMFESFKKGTLPPQIYETLRQNNVQPIAGLYIDADLTAKVNTQMDNWAAGQDLAHRGATTFAQNVIGAAAQNAGINRLDRLPTSTGIR